MDSQSLCWVPKLGSLMGGSEPSEQFKNFFGIIILQSVGHPPGRYRHPPGYPPGLILSWLHLSYHLTGTFSLSLDMRYLSLIGSIILLLMAVQ